MKIYIVLFLTLSLAAMDRSLQRKSSIPPLLDSQIKQFITYGSHQEVEALLADILKVHNNPEDYLNSPLLHSRPVDIETLHAHAHAVAEDKKQTAQTLNNSGTYKRLAAALFSLGIGGYGIANFIWQKYQSGQWEPSDFFGTVSAAGALGLHSIFHFKKALNNHDARQDYANQVAILHLIESAKQKLLPQSAKP